MAAVQLHCPHCGGLFQIDETLAGQHVSCPLGLAVVAIPDLSPAAAPPPPEFVEPPPATEEAQQLGCPVCGGLFQVTRSLAGRQVSCPHCFTAVLVPEIPAPPAMSTSGGWGGPTPEVETAPRHVADARQAAEQSRPVELDELLPPSAPRKPHGETKREKNVEEPLPLAAEKSPITRPAAEAEKTTARPAPSQQRPEASAAQPVLIPTDDGSYISLREPVKTVAIRGREIELRRLSPEEKERRRFRRNLVVAGVGLLALIITMLVMGLRGGF
jgi:hypothetical protein